MALTYSTPKNLGDPAPDFDLPATDGKNYSLKSFADCKALIVIFTCNHCPYVIAVQDRINDLAKKFGPQRVALIGINSNDSVKYPDDSFEAMKTRAQQESFVFPYLHDADQSVARAYGAVCTPDPYVFENVSGNFQLRYQGQIDDNWRNPQVVKRHDLANAVEAILAGRQPIADQKPSMGCSIKWK